MNRILAVLLLVSAAAVLGQGLPDGRAPQRGVPPPTPGRGPALPPLIGIPASNWNGRFLGTGGGGFSGGSAEGVNQPVALCYASGATDPVLR